MSTVTKSEREEACERLREILKPGDTVHCVLRHVSKSGMMREISPLKSRGDGGYFYLGRLAHGACGWRLGKHDQSVRVSGCGMDMGFHLVYNLARTLWPNGFGCIGEGCPSNDHSNGDRDYTPHGHRGPQYVGTKESLKHWHNDGGYALSSRWI